MNKEEKQAFKEIFHALLDMLEEFSLEDLESPFKGQIEAIKYCEQSTENFNKLAFKKKVVIVDNSGKVIGRQG